MLFLLAITAEDIVRGAEDLMRGMSSWGVYRMEVYRPGTSFWLEAEFWDDRSADKSLVVITDASNPRDVGNVFLKRGRELWVYMPRVRKTTRMPPSMMAEAWMGSDLTNDDLVKEASLSRDYDPQILRTERAGSKTRYVLELVPKPGAPVVWGKIVISILLPGYVPEWAEYYDERGELVRRVVYSDVKRMGGRLLPTRMEVQPVEKPGYKTVLIIKKVKFNVKIPPERFEVSKMAQWAE